MAVQVKSNESDRLQNSVTTQRLLIVILSGVNTKLRLL